MGKKIAAVSIGLAVLAAGAVMAVANPGYAIRGGLIHQLTGRTDGEWIRYLLRRLDGHPKLESFLKPGFARAQSLVERPVDHLVLPNLGKGQQSRDLPPLTGQGTAGTVLVSSAEELLQALKTAKPGQTVEIGPGTYRLGGKTRLGSAGVDGQPITLRARRAGSAVLELNSSEGFLIDQPHWVFENLHLKAACGDPDNCEHALHLVGNAHHFTLRNSRIENYHAHVKVNGEGGRWPDHGLVEFTTLTNDKARSADKPVTFLDLVGAHHWHVQDSLISHAVKSGPNETAYGMFFKGGSKYGRFERNLVVCSARKISDAGVRVGLSFGGGTTGKTFCRDGQCSAEHTGGLAANNVVAHCNDFGLDINKSDNITLAHNTLINTAGIGVRGSGSGVAYGNQLEGALSPRPGSLLRDEFNVLGRASSWFQEPDALQLRRQGQPTLVPVHPLVKDDFCGKPRSAMTPAGALGPDCLN